MAYDEDLANRIRELVALEAGVSERRTATLPGVYSCEPGIHIG